MKTGLCADSTPRDMHLTPNQVFNRRSLYGDLLNILTNHRCSLMLVVRISCVWGDLDNQNWDVHSHNTLTVGELCSFIASQNIVFRKKNSKLSHSSTKYLPDTIWSESNTKNVVVLYHGYKNTVKFQLLKPLWIEFIKVC